jgi:hypothetical protein
MVAIIAVSITIVVPDNGEFELTLGELRRELPVAYAEVLLGHKAPERVREH